MIRSDLTVLSIKPSFCIFRRRRDEASQARPSAVRNSRPSQPRQLRRALSKRIISLGSRAIRETSSVRKDLQSTDSPRSMWRSLLCHLPGRSFSTTMIVEYAPGSPISWEEAQKAGSTRSAYSPSAELESSLTSSIRMIVLTIISGS